MDVIALPLWLLCCCVVVVVLLLCCCCVVVVLLLLCCVKSCDVNSTLYLLRDYKVWFARLLQAAGLVEKWMASSLLQLSLLPSDLCNT